MATELILNVLLVEDSPTDRLLTEETLAQSGRFQLRACERLSDAIRLLSSDQFDVVLLDLGLPDCQGLETLRRLRERHSRVPVVVLTGRDDEELALRAIQEGAEDYLAKNATDSGELLRVIRYAVERAQAAERLRSSEDNFRLVLECVKDYAIVMLDLAGIVVSWNMGAERILGYMAHEVLGRHYSQFFLNEDVASGGPQAELEHAATNGRVDVKGWRLRKDGSRFWANGIVTALRDESGKLRGFAKITRDLTEQWNAEEALRQSNELLRAAFEYTDIATVVTDLACRFVRANAAFARLFGYSLDEILHLTMADITHPDDIGESRDRCQGLVTGEESFFQLEKRYVHKNGHILWGLTNVALVRDANGAPQLYVGQVQNITERKGAEEANARFIDRLKILHRIDQALIAGEDPATIATAALPPLRELLGVRHAVVSLFDPSTRQVEWLADDSGSQLFSDARVRDSIEFMGNPETLKEGGPQFLDVHKLPAGPAVDALLESGVTSYALVPMIVNEALIGSLSFDGTPESLSDEQMEIAREIATQFAVTLNQARMTTALKEKNEEFRDLSQQLWQSTKLATMGELAANIAHELNNPLATIALGIEDLLTEVPPESMAHRELTIMEQETERMAGLVANLLQFSRPGHQQISTFHITEEIDMTLEFSSFFLRKRNVVVTREYSPGVPHIQGDRQKLRQVFLNLIVNSRDAMPQGGTLTIRVESSSLANGKPAVLVEFRDTGIGIPPDNLARLAEPFFTTKPEGQGTGLGLAICRRVVQEHRGLMHLESEVDRGTSVRLTIPVHNGDNGKHLDED